MSMQNRRGEVEVIWSRTLFMVDHLAPLLALSIICRSVIDNTRSYALVSMMKRR